MVITIGDNLKLLRKKKGNTQEDLAVFLSVSIAAVSKWERAESYPDIELLPRISVYYDTTVDDLLGVGQARKDERIRELGNQTRAFWKSGDSLACVDLWRSAAKEFPNDDYVTWQLMQALSNATGVQGINSEARDKELLKEIVEIGEALSSRANDQSTMYCAMYRLCKTYMFLGEDDKAIGIANKLPMLFLSREESLLRILKGVQLREHTQSFVLTLLRSISHALLNLNRSDLGNEQAIQVYNKAIQLFELFFEDGDYGTSHYNMRDVYKQIAMTYANIRNSDSVIENLNAAANHAISYDLLDDSIHHTSVLFNGMKTPNQGKTYMYSEAQSVLKDMESDCYDFCRDDERFIEIISSLTSVTRKNMST